MASIFQNSHPRLNPEPDSQPLSPTNRPEPPEDSSLTSALRPPFLGEQPPAFTRLLDPFCNDSLHLHTTLNAALKAAGLPLPRADGSLRALEKLAQQARIVLAARDVLRQAEAEAKRQEVVPRSGSWWRPKLPWPRQAAAAGDGGGNSKQPSDVMGSEGRVGGTRSGGSAPQWRPGSSITTIESMALGAAVTLLKAHPGHAFLVPDEQQALSLSAVRRCIRFVPLAGSRTDCRRQRSRVTTAAGRQHLPTQQDCTFIVHPCLQTYVVSCRCGRRSSCGKRSSVKASPHRSPSGEKEPMAAEHDPFIALGHLHPGPRAPALELTTQSRGALTAFHLCGMLRAGACLCSPSLA